MSDILELLEGILADHDKHVAAYVADGGAAPDYATEKWAEDNSETLVALLRATRAEIAALREARAALVAGDDVAELSPEDEALLREAMNEHDAEEMGFEWNGARWVRPAPVPDPLDVAHAAETARMDAGFARALAELPKARAPYRVPARNAANAAAPEYTLEPSDIEPDEALQDAELNRLLHPTAPEPDAARSDAPRVRLTRAQRDALALLDKHNFFESEYINEHTLKALQRRGLVTYSRDWHGLAYITDAGRAALRDAGADDARGGTPGGEGE